MFTKSSPSLICPKQSFTGLIPNTIEHETVSMYWIVKGVEVSDERIC